MKTNKPRQQGSSLLELVMVIALSSLGATTLALAYSPRLPHLRSFCTHAAHTFDIMRLSALIAREPASISLARDSRGVETLRLTAPSFKARMRLPSKRMRAEVHTGQSTNIPEDTVIFSPDLRATPGTVRFVEEDHTCTLHVSLRGRTRVSLP